MRLVNFEDVHPNWNLVQRFDAVETRTLLEILVTATLLDGKVTDAERQTLTEEYARLPLGKTSIDSDTVSQMFETASERLAELRKDPDQFAPYLDRVCEGIETEPKRRAALRLLAMLSVADGVTEEEFDFCRAVGYRFELEGSEIDEVLRETWEARQDYLVEHVPGVDRAIRPVTGAHFFEDRKSRKHQYPLQQPESGTTAPTER